MDAGFCSLAPRFVQFLTGIEHPPKIGAIEDCRKQERGHDGSSSPKNMASSPPPCIVTVSVVGVRASSMGVPVLTVDDDDEHCTVVVPRPVSEAVLIEYVLVALL
jgi:hypothetical protein